MDIRQSRAMAMRENYRNENLEAVFEEFDTRAFQGGWCTILQYLESSSCVNSDHGD